MLRATICRRAPAARSQAGREGRAQAAAARREARGASEARGCAPAIGKGPHVGAPERDPPRRGWRSLAGLAEGRGRRWHCGQKARRAVPKEPDPPAPPVPAGPWPGHPGYLSVGPMQAVSVLSISRRIRSCSAAVSRLSASAILPRSIEWGRPAACPLLQISSPFAPTLTPSSRASPAPGNPQDDPALKLGTPPSSPRPPTFHAMPSGICSFLGDVE